jgi:peptide maturation system protein (TIGR04066 family)
MIKHKTMVYPYNLKISPIVRHRDLLENHQIVSLVSPEGWGMTGKDASLADNGEKLGITIRSDFEACLDLCDTVLFCQSVHTLDYETVIKPKILKAIQLKKDIIITIPLEKEEVEYISQQVLSNNLNFEYYGHMNCKPDNYIGDKKVRIYDIETPVIFVMGMGGRTNKFEIQLSLRENLLKMGYNVSQIGSRGYCELFGFHSFPDFMYSDKITESNKILLFNHFVKNIEKTESPDLIVIGIPGGIMPINDTVTNNFGILSYEVSQAVVPDLAVFGCHCEQYNKEYFTEIKKLIKYKFNSNIECFCIANSIIDGIETKYNNKAVHISVSSEYVDNKVQAYTSYGEKIFNALNPQDSKKMTEHIVDVLANYCQSICV